MTTPSKQALFPRSPCSPCLHTHEGEIAIIGGRCSPGTGGTEEQGTAPATPSTSPGKVDGFSIKADTREQRPWIFAPSTPVVRGTLPTGDYAIAGLEALAAIERKELSDFVACVTVERERFMREMSRLAAYGHRAVIIEATVEHVEAHAYRSRTAPRAVLATALSITSDFGIPVLWAGDRAGGAWSCEWLLRRVYQRFTSSDERPTR